MKGNSDVMVIRGIPGYAGPMITGKEQGGWLYGHQARTTILLGNWCVLITVKPSPPCHNFASQANRCAGQAHAAASHRRRWRDFRRSAVCLRKRLSLRLRKSRAPG